MATRIGGRSLDCDWREWAGPTDDSDDEFVAIGIESEEQRVIHNQVLRQEVRIVCDGRRQHGLRVRADVQRRLHTRCTQRRRVVISLK